MKVLIFLTISFLIHLSFYKSVENKTIKEKNGLYSEKVVKSSNVKLINIIPKQKRPQDVKVVKKDDTKNVKIDNKEQKEVKKEYKNKTKTARNENREIVSVKTTDETMKQRKRHFDENISQNKQISLTDRIVKSGPKIQEETKTIQKISDETSDKTKELLDVYDDFDTLSKEQKNYLTTNIKTISSITQRNIVYPRRALLLKQEGENIIQFELHPDGVARGFKTIKSSKHFILDLNTKKTISRIAKEYPKTKEIVLVKIKIKYEMR